MNLTETLVKLNNPKDSYNQFTKIQIPVERNQITENATNNCV